MASEPICILVCALGGEGGGVLAEWLYGAALRAGHAAQSTSIPGVAQRTGATTYYVEVCPEPDSAMAGRRPIFSLSPVPGAIDLLASSELLETVRQVAAGMASAARTQIVSSTARALTVAEKMQMADGRADTALLLATLQRHCRSADMLDMTALAQQAGTSISAVLFGAIAASKVLPFEREIFEATIRAGGKGVEPSLSGFALAYGAMAQRQMLQAAMAPAVAPDLLALARQRLLQYQDAAYVGVYEQRLARVRAAEMSADAQAAHKLAITQEMTRWLALWMAFDDIVQVAHLKLATARQARVRREVAARDDEIVKVFEHFKPGVPELAGLLPVSWADRITRWDRQRVAAGREPWALALKLGSHSVWGTLALRLAAGLKGQRRRGSRFALEQALIERWLRAVEAGTREDWALGHELAQCGRLIKGYGSTNERGKENLLHIIDHLASGPAACARPAAERAAAVRSARQAAQADESGRAFDLALLAQGAPQRAPREQQVRWYKRKPGSA